MTELEESCYTALAAPKPITNDASLLLSPGNTLSNDVIDIDFLSYLLQDAVGGVAVCCLSP